MPHPDLSQRSELSNILMLLIFNDPRYFVTIMEVLGRGIQYV